MVDKGKIRKALETLAEENKIDMKAPDKLYATNTQPKEIETEGGLFKVRVSGSGHIEIESPLGPRIGITPVHLDELAKATCPKGAIYQIKTSDKTEENIYFMQGGVVYVDSEGLVMRSEKNIRINPEVNKEE